MIFTLQYKISKFELCPTALGRILKEKEAKIWCRLTRKGEKGGGEGGWRGLTRGRKRGEKKGGGGVG